MKRIFSSVVVITMITLTACGQKVKESSVPAAVKQAFTSKYPGVTATWEKEDGNYEVSFKKEGNAMSQLITPAGIVLETETDIPVSELPQPARTYLDQHYKGKKIKETARIEKDGKTEYEAEVDGKDVMFDVNGNFIKEIKE